MTADLERMKSLLARFDQPRFEDGDGSGSNAYFPPAMNAVEIFAEERGERGLVESVGYLRAVSRYLRVSKKHNYTSLLADTMNWIDANLMFDLNVRFFRRICG